MTETSLEIIRKHTRRNKTNSYRSLLGPDFDMYVAPYDRYDIVLNRPLNDAHNPNTYFNGYKLSPVIRENHGRSMLIDAVDYVSRIRKYRRELNHGHVDPLTKSLTQRSAIKARQAFLQQLNTTISLKDITTSHKYALDITLTDNIDAVGVVYTSKYTDNIYYSTVQFILARDYYLHVYLAGLYGFDDNLILYAKKLEQRGDVSLYDVIMTRPTEVGSNIHEVQYMKLGVTYRNGEKKYIFSRSVDNAYEQLIHNKVRHIPATTIRFNGY